MKKKDKALIIVDAQYSFCKDNIIISLVQDAIIESRRYNYRIIFTKMIYDRKKLPDTVKRRNTKFHKNDLFLAPNTKGASLYKLTPMSTDVVIEKNHYDPFSNEELERCLINFDVKELIVCGFYLDVCVDSLVRGAYQRGYPVTLLYDATKEKHYKKQDILSFMETYYDTNISTVKEYFDREESLQ